jgi:hypothetical protein
MSYPLPNKVDATVEINLGGVWTDITEYVYSRDPIVIHRGRSSEASQADPSQCTLTLDNRDGRFSPRNPTGPYFGALQRNTPLRVSTTDGGTRFVGELSSLPARWDPSGSNVYVQVTASGLTRRLQQGAAALQSTMYRGVTRLSTAAVAYWPMEDGKDATAFASAIPGGRSMGFRGVPTFAVDDSFHCSASLPQITLSQITGYVSPSYAGTGDTQLRFLLAVPEAGSANDTSLIRFFLGGGSLAWVELNYGTVGGGSLQVRWSNTLGVEDEGSFITFGVDGLLLRVHLGLSVDGSDTDVTVTTLEVGESVGLTSADTITGLTFSDARAVQINPPGSGGHDEVTIGHVSVEKQITSLFDLAAELNAHTGEAAGRRIERLCDEEGITFESTGDLDESVLLGFQTRDTLVNLLREAADTDLGLLYESRTQSALAFKPHSVLFNRTAGATFDYPSGQIAGLDPTEDDQYVINDVTVTRKDGGAARVEQASGVLNVQDPPDGIGRYDVNIAVSVADDDQCVDQANWRLHLGTTDEAHYPSLPIQLSAPGVDAALAADVWGLDIGDRVVVTNPPAWLPPEDISQAVQGYTETIHPFAPLVDLNCTPESPWSVGEYESAAGDPTKYSSDGSTLSSSATATATSLSVATASGPLWTTDGAQVPFDVMVAGERITVTAISGASSPQTFTVTRSVNGVLKAHDSGETVALFSPAIFTY